MVKKGGKLPAGHINDWFWEDKDMKGYMATRLPKGAILTMSRTHSSPCLYIKICRLFPDLYHHGT